MPSVFSVSSSWSELGSQFSSTFEQNKPSYEDFWQISKSIGVFAAGNNGNTKYIVPHDTIEHVADTALSVGEAKKLTNGTYIVKSTSNRTGNISLVAPNITDEGFAVNYINQTPSITEEHHALVKEWYANQELAKAIKEKETEDPSFNHWYQFRKDFFEQNAKLHEQKATEYIANPSSLHEDFLRPYRDAGLLADDGLTRNLGGTSFTAPYVAGCISGAVALGYARAQENKPILTPEELVSFALLSCDPVSKLENTDNTQPPKDIPQTPNARGLKSSYRAGFGVFNREKYKQLIEGACQKLDTNPELSSQGETITAEKVRDKKDNEFIVKAGRDGKDKIALKLRLEYKCDCSSPVYVDITSPDGTTLRLNATQGTNTGADRFTYPTHSWAVTDRFLGEDVKGNWKIKLLDEQRNEIEANEMKLVIHTAEKGCLIDQIINQQVNKAPERRR